MKKKKMRAVCGLLAAVLVGSEVCRLAGPATVQAQEMNNMDVWVMDSADRAFESSVKGENAETKVVLYAARNEYEAAQVLVRSSENLNGVYLEASDLVGENGEKIGACEISIFREYSHEAKVPGEVEKTPDGSNRYTDALFHNEKVDVSADVTQPYWVRVHVPKGQTPGWYQGNISVKTEAGEEQIPLSVKVYDVTIPDTDEANYKMLNWFGSVGCDFGALESSIPSQYDVEIYDENWWKVIENFAKDLALHRNNVAFFDVQALLMPGSRKLSEEEQNTYAMMKEVVDVTAGDSMNGRKINATYENGEAVNSEKADVRVNDAAENRSMDVSGGNQRDISGGDIEEEGGRKAVTLALEEGSYHSDENGIMRAGDYLFDWNTFDRITDIFKNAGALQYFYAPGSYLKRNDNDRMDLWVLEEVDGKMTRVAKPIYLDQAAGIVDPEIEEYVQVLFGALRAHIEEKYPEYLDKFYISAQDEPSKEVEIQAANWFYSTVKKAYPESMSNEAHSRFITGLTETSTLCPVLDIYEDNQEFYQEQRAKGKELWFYTCIGPQGEYLNRFIPYHLVKTRLIPWYVKKIGASGYLHWGYCWWRTSDTFDSVQTGDEWLVRPDVENYDVFSSVRNEAQLDGIEDYELITLLEKQDADAAAKIVDTMITSATVYTRDGESAQEAHKALLDLLTGEEADPVAVPIFSENFSSGFDSAWSRLSGSWSVKENGYFFAGAGSNNEGMSALKGWTLKNGKIEMTMEIGDTFGNDDTMWGGITFRKNGEKDTMWQSGYTLYLRKNGQMEFIKTQPFAVLGQAKVSKAGKVTFEISMIGD